MLLLLGVNPATQSLEQRTPATAEFLKRVEGYSSLHRRVAEKIGTLDPTRSPAEISTREKAFGQAMIAARPDAKPGDVFGPSAALFRQISRTGQTIDSGILPRRNVRQDLNK